MATRRVEIGPTGETVRENIARTRRELRLTLRDVADRLADTDRPLAHNTLSEIERGARRVDVDDLLAISIALDIPPSDLLLPGSADETELVNLTGAHGVTVRAAWEHFNGLRSLRGSGIEFAIRALPQFLSIRRTALSSSSRLGAERELWVLRRLETNGSRVNYRIGESLTSDLEDESGDD